MQLLLYLLNSIYLNPGVYFLLLFGFSQPFHGEAVSKQVSGAELMDMVKP